MHAKSLQSCPTLCDPVDCRSPGSLFMGFSRQEYWSWLPCPFTEEKKKCIYVCVCVCVCVCVYRERDRERHRETERETEKEKDKQPSPQFNVRVFTSLPQNISLILWRSCLLTTPNCFSLSLSFFFLPFLGILCKENETICGFISASFT